MFERNLFAKRFLSITLVVLSPARKNFRVSEMLSVENLGDKSVSSCPSRHPKLNKKYSPPKRKLSKKKPKRI
jgi:hypothetical protein